MITTDEILARMRNGETADTIADELAKVLNLAQKALIAEQANSKKETKYKEACANATAAINEALDAYADWKGVDMGEYKWDVETCAGIIELLAGFGDLLSVLGLSNKSEEAKDDTFEDIVDRFMRENNIK